MQLTIKLTDGATLRDAALEIHALNAAMEPLLVNGPLPCNPDSETVEGFLGDANTPPNEFGYVTVGISAYRKLILPNVAPQSFSFVFGEPVEDVTQEDGSIIEVKGGTLL